MYGSVSRNRRANVTLVAALSLQGMGEAFILEGSADAAVFELYNKRSPMKLPAARKRLEASMRLLHRLSTDLTKGLR